MRVSAALLSAIIISALLVVWLLRNPHEKKSESITLYGNVDVRQVDISFRVFGRIQTMLFQEGDLVTQGALMATLDDQQYADQVRRAEANTMAVQRALANAEQVVQRREELVLEGGVSQEEYEGAKSQRDVYRENLKEAEAAFDVASISLADTQIYSPSDGVILTRIREPGSVVQPTEPIYTLSLLSPIWVRAFVTERQLGEIYSGMDVEIYTDSKGAGPYKGKIGFISPVAEFTPKTVETTELRTDLVYRIRIYAENPDRALKQGMPVTVKLSKN